MPETIILTTEEIFCDYIITFTLYQFHILFLQNCELIIMLTYKKRHGILTFPGRSDILKKVGCHKSFSYERERLFIFFGGLEGLLPCRKFYNIIIIVHNTSKGGGCYERH